MSNKMKHAYKGNIKKLPYTKIYINVNYLVEGPYELNIIYKNKIIKKTKFKK